MSHPLSTSWRNPCFTRRSRAVRVSCVDANTREPSSRRVRSSSSAAASFWFGVARPPLRLDTVFVLRLDTFFVLRLDTFFVLRLDTFLLLRLDTCLLLRSDN